jgi:hypothetical protein
MRNGRLDQTNRFVITVLALVVAFAALVLVLLAWGAPDASIRRLGDLVGYLRDHNSQEAKLILTLGALVLVLLMLTVLIVELTPSPEPKVRLHNVSSGEAAITTRQIAERINTEVQAIPHIAACDASITARGDRIEVVLDLHVDPGADLGRTADEACRRAHMLVAEQLGVELAARPRARLHYRELRLREDAARPAAPPAARTGWERPESQEVQHQPGNPDAPEKA